MGGLRGLGRGGRNSGGGGGGADGLQGKIQGEGKGRGKPGLPGSVDLGSRGGSKGNPGGEKRGVDSRDFLGAWIGLQGGDTGQQLRERSPQSRTLKQGRQSDPRPINRGGDNIIPRPFPDPKPRDTIDPSSPSKKGMKHCETASEN